ncbi:hypothetical protein DQ04_10901000, partial [Trypanosoma grayi]|uniref:hypothetical protein n=1 Tax=Trypanosoma grayi TaxID=71804 RepID=UPI0004F4671F
MEDRVLLVGEGVSVPKRVEKLLMKSFVTLGGIIGLLNCDVDGVLSCVVDLIEARDYFCRLCGGEDVLAGSDVEDATRAECVHVMKRAIARLSPSVLEDSTLRLPVKMQRCVQETIQELERLRDGTEEASDLVVKLQQDVQTLMNAGEASLRLLRGDASTTMAVSGGGAGEGGSGRLSVSLLARSLVSYAGDNAGRLRDLRAACDECSGILAQARRCELPSTSLNSSTASSTADATSELLLVDHCREIVNELLVLRAGRRSSLAVMERGAAESEQLVAAAHSAVEALSSALDESSRTTAAAASVGALCAQLESCAYTAAKQLRERDRLMHASAALLQEALAPGVDCISPRGGEVLLSIAGDAVRALEAGRVELDSVRGALEQSRGHVEELQRRVEKEACDHRASMVAQVQAHDETQSQLKEAMERQVAATAHAAKLLRTLAGFSGSVAAITLHSGLAKEGGTGTAEERPQDQEQQEAVEVQDSDVVSRERLDAILAHCADIMMELETTKARAKLLASEADELRGRLRDNEDAMRELEFQVRSVEAKAATRGAEMSDETAFLRDALAASEAECEKMQQQAQALERRLDGLRAEMAESVRSHGSERDSLSKVHSSLLSENQEMQQQLEQLGEELRAGRREVQGFLRESQASSLSEAALRSRGAAAEAALGLLAR